MRPYRNLLLERVNVRLPGLHLRAFALHRHLDETTSVRPHRHGWSQVLLYLQGEGVQNLSRQKWEIVPGRLALLPPEVEHSFARGGRGTPLCLMIDFSLRGDRKQTGAVVSLSRAELLSVQQSLNYLMKLPLEQNLDLRWEHALQILQILLTCLRAGNWVEHVAPAEPNERVQPLLRWLEGSPHDVTMAEIVKKSGYHPDYLNRILKKETGITLGQFLIQRRLNTAKELLRREASIAAVGAKVGMTDANYFARWFRRQTGLTPSAWRASGAHAPVSLLSRGQSGA